ncbi:MAG: transcription termination/antitermination protein NusG [Kiritimatiellales bacterium]|nr:transcription termination/antitermination protein NusG [Kiritimatiellota bacterium]MBL7011949.1 transcription termination/antitermination protein NusG [Kiritimatiellales bacterium]
MKKQWFVLHTLSGHEQKVQSNISSRVQQEEMEELIGEILIPTENVSEVKQGKKTTVKRKFFPGYVLANVALYDDEKNLIAETWSFIQETPSVIGFIGGVAPVPLRDDEVDNILNQVEEKKEKVTPKIQFEPGETVRITDGPFLNFNGVIEEVDPARGKLKVSVSIFGRTAPVELEYWQADKAS